MSDIIVTILSLINFWRQFPYIFKCFKINDENFSEILSNIMNFIMDFNYKYI